MRLTFKQRRHTQYVYDIRADLYQQPESVQVGEEVYGVLRRLRASCPRRVDQLVQVQKWLNEGVSLSRESRM
jgi:hypothetical protein